MKRLRDCRRRGILATCHPLIRTCKAHSSKDISRGRKIKRSVLGRLFRLPPLEPLLSKEIPRDLASLTKGSCNQRRETEPDMLKPRQQTHRLARAEGGRAIFTRPSELVGVFASAA